MIWNSDLIDHYTMDEKSFERNLKLETLLNGKKFQSPFLNNNASLRKPYLKFEYTDEELVMFKELKEDNRLLPSLVNLHPYKIQETVLDDINDHQYNLFVVSRQMGISFLAMISALNYIINNKDKTVLIISKSSGSSNTRYNDIISVYKSLPFFLKPGIVSFNHREILFDNGSRIRFLPDMNPVGITIDFLIIEDFAFFEDDKAKKYIQGVFPTIYAIRDSKIIIYSIPNGDNLFHTLATKSSNFNVKQIPYTMHPKPSMVKKEANQLGITGLLFEQEYNCRFLTKKMIDRDKRLNKIL